MINILKVDGYSAVVNYDPDIDMFRGEFTDLNGGADFYATTIDDLKKEAKISLDTFLTVCKERNIEPIKTYSGRFNTRIPSELHKKLVLIATVQGKSINDFVKQAIEKEIIEAETT
ncbi:hypothetical protein GCM10023206_31380 [Acinetobacter puyangensis]|uniref:Predicted nuclease of the RNAse H fold, HicB family n=1 Tax=Acinetobacter puyangensis TaxID=1096779 RepID=A0A240E3I0_9GAMM|nr:type II toxin-antitoxin system HicB family antitoxin [Acinetobacter puyangensis]SNX43096.1 Predicted nuclease of the RNAse H fold, HicB family [Acinetobacter puyangensis]